MKKQLSLATAASAAVLILAACGDGGSSASGFGTAFAYTEETLDDLPNCTAKREQDTAFVRDGNEIYVCEDSRWKFVRAVIDSVKTVDELSACTNSREGDSVLVTSLNAVYVCGNGKWYLFDVEDLLESSSSETVSSSSSALVVSSSSAAVSSSSNLAVSSSSLWKANWQYLNPGISYGEMTDARDGQVYKTVQIGGQTWMAENLNYDYDIGTAKSFCYGSSADSCAKYGRLYQWSAAMDSAGVFSTAGKGCGNDSTCAAGTATVVRGVRGVCPEGWHLPSREEFNILIGTVGGQDVAGTALKSTSGWDWDDDRGESGNGRDFYGFSALPAGNRFSYGIFNTAGILAYFWHATEVNSAYALGMYLSNSSDRAGLDNDHKYHARSVRCLRDSRL